MFGQRLRRREVSGQAKMKLRHRLLMSRNGGLKRGDELMSDVCYDQRFLYFSLDCCQSVRSGSSLGTFAYVYFMSLATAFLEGKG